MPDRNRTFLVAELGQNHNGSLAVALEMVDAVARPYDADTGQDIPWRWDAVKTTKRDLDYELARSAAETSYTGRNSFGATYAEHRQALELSWEDHARIRERAKAHGLCFVLTMCAPTLVDGLPFGIDYAKVASRDLTHGPLLEALRDSGHRVILSTGMHGPDELRWALDVLGPAVDVSVLHCVSSYPTAPKDVNLRTIEWLQEHHPGIRVGFSDHTVGLLAGPLAVALGASMLEKHVSLWRGMRGSDHRGALGPDGAWRYVRNVRHAEQMLGERAMFCSPAANAARMKLERSLAAAHDLPAGTVLGSSNTVLLSPGTGIPWPARKMVFGRRITEPVPARELIPVDVVEGSSGYRPRAA